MHCGFLSKTMLGLIFELLFYFLYKQIHHLLIHTLCYSSPDLNLRGFVVKCGCGRLRLVFFRVIVILRVIDTNAAPLLPFLFLCSSVCSLRMYVLSLGLIKTPLVMQKTKKV